jgi:hypothetical protein
MFLNISVPVCRHFFLLMLVTDMAYFYLEVVLKRLDEK